MAEFSVDVHAPKLRALQERGVYLGTSSWIYEGWIGQVYRDGYLGKRGAFSKTRFRAECLAEHARVFPTVCFDGAYYRAPSEKQLRTYQEELRRADGTSSVMAFKVSEALMIPAMVILDAFALSHTYEVVDVPDQADVDRFLAIAKAA